MARLKELGAVDVIAKPFDPMNLHEKINVIWGTCRDATEASLDGRLLDGLVECFQERTRQCLAALKSAHESLVGAARENTESALRQLRDGAHRLAGSGGTFGFPEVSALTLDLEQTIEPVLAGEREMDEDLITCVGELLTALNGVIGGGRSP